MMLVTRVNHGRGEEEEEENVYRGNDSESRRFIGAINHQSSLCEMQNN